MRGVTDLSEMGAMLQRHLSSRKKTEGFSSNLVQYFKFTTEDLRYSDVRAMLATLMGELYHRCVHLPSTSSSSRIREVAANYEGVLLHPESLFNMFCDMLCTAKLPETIWILANLGDHVPGFQWLLEKLKIIATSTETPFKVVFLNPVNIPDYFTENVAIHSANIQLEAPAILADSGDKEESIQMSAKPEEMSFLFSEIILRNPLLQRASSEVSMLLKESRTGSDLQQMIIEWLALSDFDEISPAIEVGAEYVHPLHATIFGLMMEGLAANNDDRAKGKGALPALDSTDDFLSYASQYWVTHARKAQPFGAFQSSSLHDLLHDHELLENWTRAYASHSRLLVHYGLQQSAGPIAIFAEHGLEVAIQEAFTFIEGIL
ncbi:hypothetical protein BJX62DRAFT_232257 [Aspergillus germanicus]